METFEITINTETFRVTRNSHESYTFSVFNHKTCHIIHKNNLSQWIKIEHRFGAEDFPLPEVGNAIDKHYTPRPRKAIPAKAITQTVYLYQPLKKEYIEEIKSCKGFEGVIGAVAFRKLKV